MGDIGSLYRLTFLIGRNTVRPVNAHLPRVATLRAELERIDAQAAVTFGSLHAAHLAGYDRYLSDMGGAVAVVVRGDDGGRTLVVQRPEVAAAEADAHAEEVLGHGPADLLELDPSASLVAACRRLAGGGRIAAAGPPQHVDALRAAGADVVTIDGFLTRLRRRKDADELARVAEAFRLALLAQRVVEEGTAAGRSEIALFAAAQAAAQEEAGRPLGWIATVASGPRSALVCPPFCVPGPDRVAPGAPVLCDIALRHRGYWGDATRTYGGDGEVAQVRDELTRLREELAGKALPGLPAAALFECAEAAIAARWPGAAFPHHGGHALGVEIGERPQIVPSDSLILEEGMVIAIEPGAYFEGRFGVRVEDTYAVCADGARRIDEVGP
jgi:Xaa-Pro dipeptidase